MVSRSAGASGTPKRADALFEVALQFAARARFGALDAIQDLVERRFLPVRSGRGRSAAGEQAQVLDAGGGCREERLEQQMQQQVVAPHVDDVRDRRPDLRDVREVLVRADADVGPAGDAPCDERRDDVEVRGLVRDQIVGVERPLGL